MKHEQERQEREKQRRHEIELGLSWNTMVQREIAHTHTTNKHRESKRARHSSCFYLTLQHVFICLWNLDLSFASCTSCTSAMHDITQL